MFNLQLYNVKELQLVGQINDCNDLEKKISLFIKLRKMIHDKFVASSNRSYIDRFQYEWQLSDIDQKKATCESAISQAKIMAEVNEQEQESIRNHKYGELYAEVWRTYRTELATKREHPKHKSKTQVVILESIYNRETDRKNINLLFESFVRGFYRYENCLTRSTN